jgi:rod shape-determining protein MreD
MAVFLSIPILGLALILQTAILSRLTLLSGCADLLLLIVAAWALQERVRTAWHWAVLAGILVGFVSGLPWFVPLIGYMLVAALARALTRRIWQAPLLVMFLVSFIGTLLTQLMSLLALRITGILLPLGESFSLIILPSVLLNLLLAIPVHVLVRDLANLLYPAAMET